VTERILRLRPDGVHFREVEGEIVAVDVDGGEYVAVNRSGSVLWASLVEGADFDQLAGRLDDEFGIGGDRARADVAAFVETLDARRLLEP